MGWLSIGIGLCGLVLEDLPLVFSPFPSSFSLFLFHLFYIFFFIFFYKHIFSDISFYGRYDENLPIRLSSFAVFFLFFSILIYYLWEILKKISILFSLTNKSKFFLCPYLEIYVLLLVQFLVDLIYEVRHSYD